VLHDLLEQSELYVTLFEMNPSGVMSNPSDSTESANLKSSLKTTIRSQVELEQELARIVKRLMAASGQTSVPISDVGSEFCKQHKQGVTQVLKGLNMKAKFITFLKSCHLFELKQTGKNYQITLCNSIGKQTKKGIQPTPDSISSLKDLEKVIKEIIQTRSQVSGTKDIAVNDVKKEFQNKYKITADACVKKFEPKSSLIKFLRNRSTVFRVTLINTDYRVAIAK
jgi:hypothetical protein